MTSVPAPLQGGGGYAQTPIQQTPYPVQGGGADGASDAPMKENVATAQAVAGAGLVDTSGGGAQVQQTGVQQQQQAAAVTAGGPVNFEQIIPVLTQLAAAVTQLVQVLTPMLTAQAAAQGVQAGGGAGAAAHGCGMAGCTMGAGGANGGIDATAAGAAVAPAAQPGGVVVTAASSAAAVANLASAVNAGGGVGGQTLDSGDLTVKGKRMSDDQRRNLQIVLRQAAAMGASPKVMEAAVATVITESNAWNDERVDGKDHDSLGLFQQRPQSGWGTRGQIADAVYATTKFLEGLPGRKGAIAVAADHPDWDIGKVSQKVQGSAYPERYIEHANEAQRIVADFFN